MLGRHSVVLFRRTATPHIPRRHLVPGGKKKKERELSPLLYLIPVTTFGLGCWQCQRKMWKENLIEELKGKVLGEAIPMPSDLLEDWKMAEQLEFQPVLVRGKFDHSKEIHLGPRSKISSLKASAQGKFLMLRVLVARVSKSQEKIEFFYKSQ